MTNDSQQPSGASLPASAGSANHGYSGACAPGAHPMGETFSYGIFQWIPKASGKGHKRSTVKVRVSGRCENADAVRRRTEEIVAALDAGTYQGPKNVRV